MKKNRKNIIIFVVILLLIFFITKLFYRNLSKSITNKEVTLEDIYYMICLYENDLNTLKYLIYNKKIITN